MSRYARRLVVAASLAVLVIASVAGPTSATFPGRNGRLVFMRPDDNGVFQIWTANPDLTHQVQLTQGLDWDGWMPSWSPDGTRIAFSSHHDDPDPTDQTEIEDVYTMRADGTDIRKLTDSRGFSGMPSWSPDGRWLVYEADRGDYPQGMGIYRIRSDGSGGPRRITRLPDGSTWQELPRYSPDGSRIVFDEGHLFPGANPSDDQVELLALFTVSPDGRDLRRITPWDMNAQDADWSPDGRRLVFAARLEANQGIQSVMSSDPDGRHLRALTHGDGVVPDGSDVDYQESFNPAWSPDGRSIIFVRARYTPADGFAIGLMTMRPDGSNQTWVSTSPLEGHQPDWGSARPLR